MSLFVAWWTTLAVCLVGALVPLVNTEIYLLSVSAVTPDGFAVPLAIAATTGQMIGKVGLYYVGRGVLRIPGERVRRGIAAARELMLRHSRASRLTLCASALVGLPPFYVMSIAWGAAGMSLTFFIVCGTAGRLIRFAAVALFPEFVRGILW